MRAAALALVCAGCLDYDALHSGAPDLAGADLAGLDLAGPDLARPDLAGADLAGADLAVVDLAQPDLSPPIDLAGPQACAKGVPSICSDGLSTLICDDFETGPLDKTWTVIENPMMSSVAFEQIDPCRGNRAAVATTMGPPRIAMLTQTVAPQPILYLRAYLSWQSRPFGYRLLTIAAVGGGATEIDLGVDVAGQLVLLQDNLVSATGTDAPLAGWHCFEVQMSQNQAAVWVDDVVQPKLTASFQSDPLSLVDVGLAEFDGQAMDASIEIDEVVVSTSYVPCTN